MGCLPKKTKPCKRTKSYQYNGEVTIETVDQSKLEETGYIQYFYHSPLSKLPVRDVCNKEKREPHIEISAENYIWECYQDNIKEFSESKSKYLFLITKCRNKELNYEFNEKYGKKETHQFIVGYIKKKQIIEFHIDDRICIRGPTYLFPFDESVPVLEIFGKNFARFAKEGKTLSLRHDYFVNATKTKKILRNLPGPDENILERCVREIKRLDKRNKTCEENKCPDDLMVKCLRKKLTPKGMFLRVGIDTGSGRDALGPIFDNGTFEYIPTGPEDDDSKEKRTYGNTRIKNKLGKKRGYNVYSDFLPSRLRWQDNEGNWYSEDTETSKIHFDPEFETFTYGDPTRKRSSLLKLNRDDYIFFYAGLKPCETDEYKRGCYLIGYFKVKEVIDFSALSKSELGGVKKLYSNNAHIKRADPNFDKLVVVKGYKKYSLLLNKAILIGKNIDGHNYFLKKFSNLFLNKPEIGEHTSCQRAVAHWLTEHGTLEMLSILGI